MRSRMPTSGTPAKSPVAHNVASSSRNPHITSSGSHRFKPPQSVGTAQARGGTTMASVSKQVQVEHGSQSMEGGLSRRTSLSSSGSLRAQMNRRNSVLNPSRESGVPEGDASRMEDVSSQIHLQRGNAVASAGRGLPVRRSAGGVSNNLNEGHEDLLPDSPNVPSGVGRRQNGSGSPETYVERRGRPIPGCTPNRTTESESPGLPRGVAGAMDNENVYEEREEEDKEDGVEFLGQASEPMAGGFTFLNDDPNDNGSEHNEEGGSRDELEDAGIEEENEGMAVQEYVYDDESTKRRERRQAQAAREREGNRRRQEGLRRNYLLVDEFTMKPYGVGVGDWRKELMLLSRELDPAIGNINQQPEGAVAELGIRIQETWEYSAPMKFAYVKEVIARGLTLRRVELWKKLRNNEKKPELLSDRSWKMLEKQLENPASLRKSENCRRANASRVNFRRTRPSGEVGVRERLRRRLRRSPEPEEIRVEMARDKGYGGRSRLKKKNNNSQLNREGGGGLLLDVQRRTPELGNTFDECSADFEEDEHAGDTGMEGNRAIGGGHVSMLSEEVIAQHPLVRSLMQRLEALEGQQSTLGVNTNVIEEIQVQEESEPIEVAPEGTDVQRVQVMDVNKAFQEVGDGLQSEAGEVRRRPGRPKKKAKQT